MSALFQRKPDLDGPGVRVWFAAPATMVDQVYAPGGMTTAVARYLVTEVEAEVQRRYVSRGERVRYVHDWRACASYEPEARELLLDWGRASRPHTGSVSIGMSPDASVFVRIATSSAVTVLRALGVKIEIVDDFAPVVSALRGQVDGRA